jgi:hypothetical protein
VNVESKCPFCMAYIVIDTDNAMVLHDGDGCRKFHEAADALDYIIAVKNAALAGRV